MQWDHANLAKLEAVLFYFQSLAEESGTHSGKEDKWKFTPHGECFYDINLAILSVTTFIKRYLGCGSAPGKMVEQFRLEPGSMFVDLSKLHQNIASSFSSTHARVWVRTRMDKVWQMQWWQQSSRRYCSTSPKSAKKATATQAHET